MKKTKISSKNADIDKIESLSKEINQLSGELQTDAVTHLIYTVEVLQEYNRRALMKNKATYAKIRILSTLILNKGSMRITDLSNTNYRTKSSITRTINNMLRDGLVIKSATTDDRREKLITISTKGLELVELATVNRRLASNAIMSVLTEEQITELVKLLRLVRRNIRKNLIKE